MRMSLSLVLNIVLLLTGICLWLYIADVLVSYTVVALTTVAALNLFHLAANKVNK